MAKIVTSIENSSKYKTAMYINTSDNKKFCIETFCNNNLEIQTKLFQLNPDLEWKIVVNNRDVGVETLITATQDKLKEDVYSFHLLSVEKMKELIEKVF